MKENQNMYKSKKQCGAGHFVLQKGFLTQNRAQKGKRAIRPQAEKSPPPGGA